MTLPFFYSADISEKNSSITLDETNSKHIAQVLRMVAGEELRLTNGKGLLALAEIINPHKRSCELNIISSAFSLPSSYRKVAIAISPLKNTSRFEWFLEKATELGVAEIFPVICQRTEKEHFRHERMNAICVSAMLQSQQSWLPVLHQPLAFNELVHNKMSSSLHYHQKWIAHCDDQEKHALTKVLQPTMKDSMILVGPEGDFTKEEIVEATGHGFVPVSLGETRLRSETAGVVAAVLACLA